MDKISALSTKKLSLKNEQVYVTRSERERLKKEEAILQRVKDFQKTKAVDGKLEDLKQRAMEGRRA
jgi:hypothetical protein